MLRQEMPDEMHVRIVVEADAKSRQPLRRILLGQLDEHGKFIAARLAPRGPECHEQRLASIFRHDSLVASQVNQSRVSSGRGFCHARGRFSRRRLRAGGNRRTQKQQRRDGCSPQLSFGFRDLHCSDSSADILAIPAYSQQLGPTLKKFQKLLNYIFLAPRQIEQPARKAIHPTQWSSSVSQAGRDKRLA